MKTFNLRKIILFFIDVLMVVFSYGFVYAALRMSTVFDVGEASAEILSFFTVVACITIARCVFRTYGSIWRYAGSMEYLYLVIADFVGFILNICVSLLIFKDISHCFFVLNVSTLSLVAVLVSRFCYRQVKIHLNYKGKNNDSSVKYVAIIGAGAAGVALLNEIKQDKNNNIIPYCFIDTDKTKAGSYLNGIKIIYSGNNDIAKIIRNTPVTDIIIAIPSLELEKKNDIIKNCAHTGCKVKIYEYVYDRIEGVAKSPKLSIRDVKVEDLLARGVITFDCNNVRMQLVDKVILVTGGGGSIGSELCRQIAGMSPKKLIVLDIYENNAYLVEQELKRKYGNKLDLVVEIASVRDKEKMLHIFNEYKPDYVFHAAAHKHVPLMEHNADEAVKNNIFGTHNIIEVCEKTGVEKMLLISTDKAVNPTSVMGATKRFCEMMIQSKKNSRTEYVAVRFGNVLGSNGSVLPIFQKQIEQGGPVTITDKRITRYFMTIPEAVSLVLQAFSMAIKSEIFVLDMGNPVKILDLAENMIRLSGLKPYEDIDIVEIGLRPGEKMYEELLIRTEEMDKTLNDKIFIERDRVYTGEDIEKYLSELETALESADNKVIKQCLHEIIPAFVSPDTDSMLEDTDDKAVVMD